MKRGSELLKNLSMITQLGLSLIMPVLLCVFLCWLLVAKAGVGAWVYIPGIIFGIGGSFSTAYKFYRMNVAKKGGDEAQKKRRSGNFNDHL